VTARPSILSVDAVRLLQFRAFVEPNGTLVPLTGQREIPFAIARVFYVYGAAPGITRGEHAHKQCHQLLVCVNGACEITYEDGISHRRAVLEDPTSGLWIPPSIWAMQRYLKKDSVLAVFTDRPYEEHDYIRDYQEFLAYRGVGVKRAANE
jgi:dTDP-4-dehydrorhamnose 3,5-epimerase-like enzyme